MKRLERGERGAVAVIVAVLMGGGVLLGMGALVVDTGQMYTERAQLQNGADSGALAVALSCAKGSCNTPAAGPEANGNSNDGTSDYTVCGNASGLTSCPAPSPTALTCASTPSGSYAQVTTTTRNTNGTTLLPPVFGRAVLGASYNGKTVHACAQATWGPVGAGAGIAVTYSLCTWNAGTANGTKFAPAPPYGSWPPAGMARYPQDKFDPKVFGMAGGEQVLQLHGSGNDCVGNLGSGWQLPGGFGFLDDPNNDCTMTVDVKNTYADRTGVPVKSDCITKLQTAATSHTVLYLPIYDGTQASGGNGMYHLAGFAAFVLTGGDINGQGGGFSQASTISGKHYCSGGTDKCLYGFFTQGLVPSGTPGGTNFGTSVVSLAG
jgi:Flp pilus assembly protein TadG